VYQNNSFEVKRMGIGGLGEHRLKRME
jgi:hypothetical protein